MVFLIGVVLFGSVSFLSYTFIIWARYWPTVVCSFVHKNFVCRTINGKTVYLPKISYRYFYGGYEHGGTRDRLFGGRAFSKIEDVEIDESELHCFVCPLWPSFSYLRQDFRVAWGLLAVFVLSVFMFGGLRMMHFY
jgi:hypothetical protein